MQAWSSCAFSAAAAQIATEFAALSGPALDQMLEGFFAPGWLGREKPQAKVRFDAAVEERIEHRARQLAREIAGEVARESSQHPEEPADPEPNPTPPQDVEEPQEEALPWDTAVFPDDIPAARRRKWMEDQGLDPFG